MEVATVKTLISILLATLILSTTALADTTHIRSVTVNQDKVQGGQTARATVWLAQPAPAGGFEVELWTDDAAKVPTKVIVPAGATHVEFSVSTSKVKSNQHINVAALSPQSSAHTGMVLLPNHQVVLK
jgi:hypothetical protein